jgi:hypothetical protein
MGASLKSWQIGTGRIHQLKSPDMPGRVTNGFDQ